MTLRTQEVNTIISKYPNLAALDFRPVDILGCNASNDEFTLKEIVEREEQRYWRDFLSWLDIVVGTTADISNKRGIREKLNKAPFSTLLELEFADYCTRKKIKIVPEVKTKGKHNLDYGILLCGSQVLVEVYAPRHNEMKNEVGFAPLDNGVARLLIEKMRKNAIPSDIRTPLVFVIDGTYAGIDTINVEAAFSSGNQELSLISGVVLKRNNVMFSPSIPVVVLKNSNFIWFANPDASAPLSEAQIKELTL